MNEQEEYMHEYEEYKTVKSPWGWVILVCLCTVLIMTAMLAHWFIPEVQRQWDFGQFPIAPAESQYTTEVVPYKPPIPRQVPTLPGAKPPVLHLTPPEEGYER